MGDVINLCERIADRSRQRTGAARFFFAIADPLSYLAAERVERALGSIAWVPVLEPLAHGAGPADAAGLEREARERLHLAERQAHILKLPLVEPHRFPMDSRRAARAAAYAAQEGFGAAFALAAMRLAFCGGFDIASGPVIEEAAATAGLDPAEAVAASRDQSFDLQLDATSAGLSRRRRHAPAISVGSHWFDGPDAVIAAVSFTAAQGVVDVPELPAG